MEKIDRSAFLYMEPGDDDQKDSFAQCSTCVFYLKGKSQCAIHDPKIHIYPDFSCGFYVSDSKPMPNLRAAERVTPKESGLVHRQVRCENCAHMNKDNSTCYLYDTLNKKLPKFIDLDIHVDPKGCCNAQTEAEQKNESIEVKSFLKFTEFSKKTT